jgi:CRP-like cAMP-binding protein
MTFHAAAGNRFLRAMPRPVLQRLRSRIQPVALSRGAILIDSASVSGKIYLPDRGLISLVKVMEDGRSVEVGFVGVGGITGTISLLGMEQAAIEAIVQVDVAGQCISTAALREELEGSPELRRLVLRLLRYDFDQFAQTSACNRLHTLRQRCCRWLLTAQEHARSWAFTLTHDFLAMMMGVNRPALSLTMEALQQHGLIQYRRSFLTIVDRPALQRSACECYEALRLRAEEIYDEAI